MARRTAAGGAGSTTTEQCTAIQIATLLTVSTVFLLQYYPEHLLRGYSACTEHLMKSSAPCPAGAIITHLPPVRKLGVTQHGELTS